MKNKKNMIVIVGAILFNTVFWKELLGINLLIFNLFVIGSLVVTQDGIKQNKLIISSMVGCLLSVFMVVLHNSIISIIANVVSLIVLVGIVHNKEIRSVFTAFLTSAINFFRFPDYFKNVRIKISKETNYKGLKMVRLSLIPLVIVTLFFVIFKNANPVFNDFSITFFHSIGEYINVLTRNISFVRILFFLVGLTIMNWVIYKGLRNKFALKEAEKKEDIKRTRLSKIIYNLDGKIDSRSKINTSSNLALKNENTTGLLTMGMVNLLLLVVNSIDIIYVWFGADYLPNTNLSDQVHEGTYYLILSILMSMIVMLYFFRANQNFYSKNRLLVKLAYLWIAQNIVLVFSVVIRNMHYVDYQGLTHKRIGVFIFLVLTIVGLVTLIIKIKDKKSAFYLVLKNSWATYIMLVIISLFNWDLIIAKHNMNNNKFRIDYAYLSTLSDQAIMYIDERRNELSESNILKSNVHNNTIRSLDYRIQQIKSKYDYENHTFFSWSYGRNKTQNYFYSN